MLDMVYKYKEAHNMTNLNRLNSGRKLILELLTKHTDKIKHHIKQNPNDSKEKTQDKKKD